MITDTYDIVVIGAGPAGLTAATLAARQGARVLLVDEQRSPGGQIYRASEFQSIKRLQQLGGDYQQGVGLIEGFRDSAADYLPQAKVWTIEPDLRVGLVFLNQCHMVQASQIILASGAMERPIAFPGWTLPGVMNAGAGQILFKTSNMVPGENAILAGSGPLLLLLAWQYLNAGVKIQALLDTTPTGNHFKAVRHLPKALLAFGYLRKGLKYRWALKRAGIPIFHGVSGLQALGEDHISQVRFQHRGKTKHFDTDTLMVHFGVIPVNQLSQIAGCKHQWHEGQQCWQPVTDEWGQTSQSGILVAGDGATIGGAKTARYSGCLAGIKAMQNIGKLDNYTASLLAEADVRKRRRDLSIRPFLEAYFRIPPSQLCAQDDQTLVCRCEEITAGEIRKTVKQGHLDNNQVKFLTRCGMGPCQGRQCATNVSQIIAAQQNIEPGTVNGYRARPPASVLTLGELASYDPEVTE